MKDYRKEYRANVPYKKTHVHRREPQQDLKKRCPIFACHASADNAKHEWHCDEQAHQIGNHQDDQYSERF